MYGSIYIIFGRIFIEQLLPSWAYIDLKRGLLNIWFGFKYQHYIPITKWELYHWLENCLFCIFGLDLLLMLNTY